MKRFDDLPMLVPYAALFPDAEEGVVFLTLPRKVGKAKVGDMRSSRRTALTRGATAGGFPLSSPGKRKPCGGHRFFFGFDPDDPLAGPSLNAALYGWNA